VAYFRCRLYSCSLSFCFLFHKNFISLLMRTAFRRYRFLPFILMEIYLGVNLFLSAYFIVPDCCICFIYFSFGVFVLVGFLCLFGITMHEPMNVKQTFLLSVQFITKIIKITPFTSPVNELSTDVLKVTD